VLGTPTIAVRAWAPGTVLRVHAHLRQALGVCACICVRVCVVPAPDSSFASEGVQQRLREDA